MLLVSSVLALGTALAGLFSLGLGIVHVWVPRIFAFDRAIGHDDAAAQLGTIDFGPWSYARRRSDARGLTWVMSNAASYVLVSIGLLDLAWVAGSRVVPVALGGAWIAGWWAMRAGGQMVVGRRVGELAAALGIVLPAVSPRLVYASRVDVRSWWPRARLED
jgi:hypothetical protein